MKKYVLPLFLLCTVAVNSQAQRQKWTAGIKGGLNIADVTSLNGDNRLSGHIGLYIHSKLSTQWSIQPEIYYSGQGQQFPVNPRDEATLALSYINIPLMFQYHATRQFYLEFGPQIGFLLSANVKNNGDKWEVDDSFNKVDAGLCFGIGIQATRMLGFYARYNAGLADISKEDNTFFGDRDRYNRVGQIGVSVNFK
jgi:hypothetical protein